MDIKFNEKEFGYTHAKMVIYDWYRMLNGIAFVNHNPIKKDYLIVYDYNNGEDYIYRLCLLYNETYNQKIKYNTKYNYYYIKLI